MFLENEVKKRRKINRISAQKYRERRKERFKAMERDIDRLEAENRKLREQLEAYKRIAKEALTVESFQVPPKDAIREGCGHLMLQLPLLWQCRGD